MHCCNINKSRRGGFFFGSPGMSVLLTVNIVSHNPAQSSSDNIPS